MVSLAVTPKLNRTPDAGSRCTLTSTAEYDDERSTGKDGYSFAYDRTCKSTVAVFSFDLQPKSAFAIAKTTSTTTPIGMLTRDPIGFKGSPWNLYEYVGGRPTVLNDPLGEEWRWPWTKCPPKVTTPYVMFPNAGVSAALKWRDAQTTWPNPNKILACKQLVVEIQLAEAAKKNKLADE